MFPIHIMQTLLPLAGCMEAGLSTYSPSSSLLLLFIMQPVLYSLQASLSSATFLAHSSSSWLMIFLSNSSLLLACDSTCSRNLFLAGDTQYPLCAESSCPAPSTPSPTCPPQPIAGKSR